MSSAGDGLDSLGEGTAGGANLPVALALVRLARHLKVNLSGDMPRRDPVPHAAPEVKAQKPEVPFLPSLARIALSTKPPPMITPYYVKEALHAYRQIDDIPGNAG